MSLGLNDGTYNVALSGVAGLGLTQNVIGASGDAYGQDIGTMRSGTWGGSLSYGITTDPTKSGVVADLSDGQIVVIKY